MTKETPRETIERVWENLERYYDEFNGENDRAVAILAAAHFENRLKDALVKKFVNQNKELQIDIFERSLYTFSAKINVACALGLYDQKTREGLHNVRRIRNKFAHASIPIKFEDDEIKVL